MLRHRGHRVWRVGLSNFREERGRDRDREDRRAHQGEMPLIASDTAAEDGRVVRKD